MRRISIDKRGFVYEDALTLRNFLLEHGGDGAVVLEDYDGTIMKIKDFGPVLGMLANVVPSMHFTIYLHFTDDDVAAECLLRFT